MQKRDNVICFEAFFVLRKYGTKHSVSIFNSLREDVTENKRLNYCSHLHNLVEDMHIRFADLVNLNVACWVIQSFFADPADLKVELQDHFIYLQNNDETKMNFQDDRYNIF